jgi:Xaa-Pro aminopeptidase
MADTWITDIRTWPAPEPADDGVSLLAETIVGLAGATPRVGIPMGPETHVRMPLADLERLRAGIPGVTSVDATNVIRTLRMTKSEREIAKTAHICRIVSAAFDRLPDIISVGMSEREAFRAFKIELLEQGADDAPYLVGSSGPGFDNVIKSPGDRRLEPGDLLMFDTGSVFDGYFSDFDRFFAFGHAAPDAHAAYRTVWDATEAGLEAARPGRTTSDVWRAMADVLVAGGTKGNSVGRLGHGLGMQVTEWPSNTEYDSTELTEGMVLTLEPGMTWMPGKLMLHEENIVVRAGGAELLSRRAPAEIPVI